MSAILFIACILAFIKADDLDCKPIGDAPTEDMTSMIYYATPELITTAVEPLKEIGKELILGIDIPDVDQSLDTPIGDIDLQVTDITITDLDFGNLSIDIDSTNKIFKLSISGTKVTVTCNYDVEQNSFPYLSDDGTAKASVSNLSLSVGISATREETGGMNLTLSSLSFDVGDVDIDLDGGFISNIVEKFTDKIDGYVNDYVSENYQDLFDTYVQPLIDEMNENGFYVCEDQYSCIDYRITADPSFEESGVRVYMSGYFYNGDYADKNTQVDYSEMTKYSSDKMFYMQYGKATFQSMINSLQVENLWDLQDEDNDTVMNYSDIANYSDAWKNAYPSGTNGKLQMTVSEAPSCEIKGDNVEVTIKSTFVLTPDGQTDTTNISTNVTMKMSGDVWWKDYHDDHTATIEDDAFFMTVKLSLNELTVDDSSLSKDLVEYAVKNNYLGQKNEILEIEMLYGPASLGVTINNPEVIYNTNDVVIAYDFKVDSE